MHAVCETVTERPGVRHTVSIHVGHDAYQWLSGRSASEEETLDDNECQKTGNWYR